MLEIKTNVGFAGTVYRQHAISFPQSSQVGLPYSALSRSNAAKSETEDLNFTDSVDDRERELDIKLSAHTSSLNSINDY